MDTYTALNEYYSNYDEDQRLLSRHGSVEYLTTMRYIEKYLFQGAKILEIGAGTGRYSHTLAKMGYKVEAVELIQHNIEIFKSKITPDEKISILQGNATDLSFIESEKYDITLLLGPMYHLYTVEEQTKALSEAIRVTKTGGIIYAAYCNNDATMLSFCFARDMIRDEKYQNLIDPDTFKAKSTPDELFQLYRKEDVDALMGNFDVERLHYIGSDMATNFMREIIDSMDDELFDIYLKYHLVVCEREDMVGATHHMLDIFKKLK